MSNWLFRLIVIVILSIPLYYGYVFRSKKWEQDILYFIPFFGWIKRLIAFYQGLSRDKKESAERTIYSSKEPEEAQGRQTSSRLDVSAQIGLMLSDRGNYVSSLIAHSVSLKLLVKSGKRSQVLEKAAFVANCLDDLEEGLSPTTRKFIADAIDSLQNSNVGYVYDESIYALREAQSRAEKRYRETR